MRILALIISLATGIFAVANAALQDPDTEYLSYQQNVQFRDASTGMQFHVKSINPWNVILMNSLPVTYVDCDCYFDYINHILVEDDGYTSVQGGEYRGDVVIPDAVVYNGTLYYVDRISYGAFSNCTELTGLE